MSFVVGPSSLTGRVDSMNVSERVQMSFYLNLTSNLAKRVALGDGHQRRFVARSQLHSCESVDSCPAWNWHFCGFVNIDHRSDHFARGAVGTAGAAARSAVGVLLSEKTTFSYQTSIRGRFWREFFMVCVL